MALTKGDDFPIHQTSEPIAYAGTDRNFYDRYFFNGYAAEGERFFAAGVRGLSASQHRRRRASAWCGDGVQTNLHASRWLEHGAHGSGGRADLHRGASSRCRSLKLIVERAGAGHPRRDRVRGPRLPDRGAAVHPPQRPAHLIMDYTRLTQNGRYSGWIEVDGKRDSVDGLRRHARPVMGRAAGRRARRPGGRAARAAAVLLDLGAEQFPGGSFFFHSNDDAGGAPWNRRGGVGARGADARRQVRDRDCGDRPSTGRRGTRHAKRGRWCI